MQVELINSNSNMVEVKYIVTLQEDVLSSELVVTNSKSSLLQLTGSILSHLTVSTPDATYVVGLEGSNFFNISPVLSNFGIIPPESGQKNEFGFGQFWGQEALKELLPGWGARNETAESIQRQREEEKEGEEDDDYKHLSKELSRLYTSAPRYFTVIDRVLFLQQLHAKISF